MFKVFILLSLSFLALFNNSEATCGVCNPNNGMACVSRTEFHACFGGSPNSSVTYKCPNANDICTARSIVCLDSTFASEQNLRPACADTSQCGDCTGVSEGGFSCTSRTTFTMCMGGELTQTRGRCPPFNMCFTERIGSSVESRCRPDCNEKSSSLTYCDLQDPIDVPVETTTVPAPITTTTTEIATTTTTEVPDTTTTTVSETPPTTTTTATPTPTTTATPTPTTTATPTPTTTTEIPTTTQNPVNVLCSQQSAVGRYPHPTDVTCRSYVYCYLQGNAMQATPMMCPSQMFFNPTSRLCGSDIPQGCEV